MRRGLAASSPFLRGLGQLKRPYRLLTPPVAMAHPLDGGRAVCVGGSVAQTAAGLGADGRSYQRLMSPLVRNAEEIVATFMRPLRSVPRHPVKVIPFGLEGLLPASVLDVSPAQLITMAGSRLPARYVQALRRFHYGPGVCKVDWALAGPVPWQAAACRSAGTVHLGGTMTEIAASESDVAYGRHPDRPFSIIVQAGVIDSSRAPQGKQALYGYCHVPNGSTRNMAVSRFSRPIAGRYSRRGRGVPQVVEKARPDRPGGGRGRDAAPVRSVAWM